MSNEVNKPKSVAKMYWSILKLHLEDFFAYLLHLLKVSFSELRTHCKLFWHMPNTNFNWLIVLTGNKVKHVFTNLKPTYAIMLSAEKYKQEKKPNSFGIHHSPKNTEDTEATWKIPLLSTSKYSKKIRYGMVVSDLPLWLTSFIDSSGWQWWDHWQQPEDYKKWF